MHADQGIKMRSVVPNALATNTTTGMHVMSVPPTSVNPCSTTASRDGDRGQEAFVNMLQSHTSKDQLDTVKYGYNITLPEIDSMAFSDAEERLNLSSRSGDKESLMNPVTKTSPYKKPHVRSPLKNDHKKEPHVREYNSPRKRGSQRDQNSSRCSHKQPRYDNKSKHVEHNRDSSASARRSRTSSSSSSYSPHDRNKSDSRNQDRFHSPKSSSPKR
jgi:hypothetical protein